MKALLLGGMAIMLLTGGLIMSGCGSHHGKWRGCGSHAKKAEWLVKKITKELKLDASQQTKLETIKTELLAKKEQFKPNHQALHDSLKTQILSDKIDESTLSATFDDMRSKHMEMKSVLISKFAEFHAILTPEQRQLLVKKLEKMHKCFGKFHNEE